MSPRPDASYDSTGVTSIESVSAGVDSRKNRTVDLFYRNAALADSTTLRGGNGYVAMRLRLRCGCRFSHSTRAWGVTTRVFDHSAGGYRFAFSQFAGGLSARFVHFAGGIRDLTIARGVITDSTNSRGVIALHMNANTTELRRFDQPPGGLEDLSNHPAGGYATHDLRSQLAREQMPRPTRAIC